MDDGPCMNLERDFEEALMKWREAIEVLKALQNAAPVEDLEKRLKWQDDKATASKKTIETHKVFKAASDAFMKCLEENP